MGRQTPMGRDTDPQPDDFDIDMSSVPPRARRSRAHRASLWTLAGVVVTFVGLSFLAVVIIGQTMRAPDWVRERVEARIERNLGGLQIAFGDVELVINKGWRPRMRLRDVALSGPDGARIVQLADVEASLAMRPLLRGQVQPKYIALNGAAATLRRDASGAVSLSLGEAAAPVNQAPSLVQLIETLDRVLVLPQFSALVSAQLQGLNLRWEDARADRGWTLDGGLIEMDRTGTDLRLTAGFSVLSGGDAASLVSMNYSSRIGETAAEFGVMVEDIQAGDIAAQAIALEWLDVLRAPISGALRGSVGNDGALGVLSATLQIGPGVVQPIDQTLPIPFSSARSYFSYDPAEQVLKFDEVSVVSDWGTGLMEGRAYLNGVETGRLTDLIGQFTLTNLSVNPDGLYDTALLIDRAIADFRLELDPFRLTLGQMQIEEDHSEILLSGDLSARADGWVLALDGQMDRIAHDRLIELWPERAVPKPRKWVVENLWGGTLNDISLAARITPGKRPEIYLDFDYDDATIQFIKTLPPITGAKGQANLVGYRFVTTATAGRVVPEQGGPVDISGTSFIIPDTEIKTSAPAIVRLVGTGTVTSLLSLLNRPPLSVLKDTPLPVDLADGQFRTTGTLAFPTNEKVYFEDVEFHLNGLVTDVASQDLVPGHTLTAPLLEVTGNQDAIFVEGAGKIDAIPLEARWRQPLGKGPGATSRVSGTVTLSQLAVDTFGVGLPPNTLSGSASGDYTLDLGAGQPPRLALTSDLRGLALRVPALGWAKPGEADGAFELSGTLGPQASFDTLKLQAAGLTVAGSVSTRPEGGLNRAELSTVQLGSWLNVQADLVGQGDAPPAVQLNGGTLDLRSARFGTSGDGGATGPLSASLDRLQVTDTLALTNFSGQFQTAGGLNGDFTAAVNGATRVSGQVVPQNARSAVRLRSQDAGGVFRSAGILQQARGGSFDMTLLPGPEEGLFDGTLRVRNTRVQDAPAIAALLNSISVIGLFDEMTGQGIQFSEVDAKFRLGPSRLTLYESSATGPSIGLSMDGTMEMATGTLDMQGVITPVYMLNSIGGFLTRKGEGLIGFSYKLRGPARNPEVQVNPLSALAPGMLRDIFRGAPPEPDVDPDAPVRPPVRAPDPSGDSAEGR
jgi:hypothetical protein